MRDHPGVCRFAILVALLWTACGAACVKDRGKGRDADEIKLPAVPMAPATEMAIGAVVKVTRDGRVIFDGKDRSVNELLAGVARDDRTAPIELRAHRDALWMHVQWVMAALGEAGHKEVRCAVEVAGRGTEGVVKVRLYRGVWEDKFYILPDEESEKQPWAVGMEIVPAPRDAGETGPVTAEYRLGGDRTTVTQDPEAIRKWARSVLGKGRLSVWA